MLLKWLTDLFTGGSKKDTDLRRLKAEEKQLVDQCKAEAAAGDPSARKALNALENTITEQSLRLLRANAKPKP